MPICLRIGHVAHPQGAARLDLAAYFGVPPKFWVLGGLVAVFACEWVDRSLLTVSMEAIRLEFGITDTELGAIAGSSYAISAAAVLPIGRLADKTNRRDVIAGSLALWAFGTVLSGLAQSFLQLCMARLLVGLGTAN
eukprot:SAG31_NODE_12998_length_900_cov_1.756554_2_plen_137_part_00